jgi:hypothetical protein
MQLDSTRTSAKSLSTPKNNHSARVWEIRAHSVLKVDRAAKRELKVRHLLTTI